MTEFPITLKVSTEGPGKGYPIEMTHKEKFFAIRTEPKISDVEEFIASGRDEMDLYDEMRRVGEPVLLLHGLQDIEFASFPELQSVFQKYDEERYKEITDEEEVKVADAWKDALTKEWVLTWNPADVEWTDPAKYHREVFHRKHSFDELMALKREGVDHIAKIKGVSTIGTKDEIARRIHQHDFGEEEVGETLERIDKLMTTIGDHRRVEPEKVEKPEEVPLEPEIKPEKPEEQVKLTPENIEWAIDETLTHYAEDWLKRSVRALLEEGKRDEALKFLREHCRWFGVASPGKPYVSGSEKGILITSAIMNPEETKLITWAELLKRVEAEKIKKLEEFGSIDGSNGEQILQELKHRIAKLDFIKKAFIFGSFVQHLRSLPSKWRPSSDIDIHVLVPTDYVITKYGVNEQIGSIKGHPIDSGVVHGSVVDYYKVLQEHPETIVIKE
ncbi:hypothetical protein ES703_00072 [subsurface metagenome]